MHTHAHTHTHFLSAVSRSAIAAYYEEFQLLTDSESPGTISSARFRELLGDYGTRPNFIIDRLFFVSAAHGAAGSGAAVNEVVR